LGAVVCCLGYGIASVVQSAGARRVAPITGPTGMISVVGQLPYVIGLALDGLAFLGSLVAARQLPLFLVQTVMTASVGVTVVGAAVSGTRLNRWQWSAIAALMAGLGLLALAARPGPAAPTPTGFDWIALACCLLPIALAWTGFRLPAGADWAVLSLAAGFGFAVVAVAARGLSTAPIGWSLATRPLSWALIAGGATGMIGFAAALQRGPVASVTAVSFAVELLGPAAVGIAVLGDGVAAGWVPTALLGFLLAIAGSAVLVWRT
jgi:hypothetical protein